MKKLLGICLLAFGIIAPALAAPQNNCPDPAVTGVSATQIKSRGQFARYRFTVEVTNVGRVAFVSGAGSTVTLQFSSGGKARRSMASQPLPDLAVGEVTTLIFEADVNNDKRTLPDWENMPFPAEICGLIVVKSGRGSAPECDSANNRLCQAP